MPLSHAEGEARLEWASPVIAGVLDRAFLSDELERWWLDEQSEFGVVRTAGPVPGLWLHLVTCGERFDFRTWRADAPEEDGDELLVRLTSDLQDWIAESKFGWGEQRLT